MIRRAIDSAEVGRNIRDLGVEVFDTKAMRRVIDNGSECSFKTGILYLFKKIRGAKSAR